MVTLKDWSFNDLGVAQKVARPAGGGAANRAEPQVPQVSQRTHMGMGRINPFFSGIYDWLVVLEHILIIDD